MKTMKNLWSNGETSPGINWLFSRISEPSTVPSNNWVFNKHYWNKIHKIPRIPNSVYSTTPLTSPYSSNGLMFTSAIIIEPVGSHNTVLESLHCYLFIEQCFMSLMVYKVFSPISIWTNNSIHSPWATTSKQRNWPEGLQDSLVNSSQSTNPTSTEPQHLTSAELGSRDRTFYF